ncbi:acyl carrier protein 1, chloroplastic-like [Impatiens glandulifera]|uniref:acyl carrier protein 1, chloroplastic-like n=1 Tax=Impatiens glandulifera TaxID=253017 RepID=UPI001FB06085|nr:acyl carrier protein 1, chloroplastic-like [Impatiens glandulifera]
MAFVSATTTTALFSVANNKNIKITLKLYLLNSSVSGHGEGLKFRRCRIHTSRAIERYSKCSSNCFKTTISCSLASTKTLDIVKSTIANQLSIDESSVEPQTKFVELGADSLDTVEIMMALEEKFGVSIGEEGAANIATVQDAADLIEKIKTT